VASHPGHRPDTVWVELSPGGRVVLDLELEVAPVPLPGITLRVGPDDPIGIAPLPEKSAAVSPHLEAELSLRALESSPGLAEAGLGQSVGSREEPVPGDPSSALLVRGSTADLKLVLLDGAPVYAPFNVGGLLQSFDTDLLAGASYHVGGAPARYDGGLSYLLDLRTRPARRDGRTLSGSADLVSAGATVDAPLTDRVGVLLSGRATHGLASRLSGARHPPYGYRDGLARFDWTISDRSRLSVTAFGNRQSVRLDLPGPDAAPRSVQDVPNDAVWGNASLAAAHHTSIAGTALEVTAAASRYEAELPIREPDGVSVGAGDAAPLVGRGRTDRLRLAVDGRRPVGAGVLRLGFSVHRTEVLQESRRLAEVAPIRRDDVGTAYGLYVDASLPVGPGVDVRAGGRTDYFALGAGDGGGRGSLRASLLVELSPEAVLTLSGGRYHRVVRAGDVESEVGLGGGGGTLPADLGHGESTLSVARADHIVASLDQELLSGLRLAIDGFYKTFHDLPDPSDAGLRSSGVDLRLTRNGGAFGGWFGYSLSWFWRDGSGRDHSSDFAGRHLLGAGLDGPIAGPLGFEIGLSFSDGLPLSAVPVAGAVEDGDFESDPDPAVSDPTLGIDDGFLRLDAEVDGDFEGELFGRTVRLRPYLRLLNALDSRDALFFYFDPWRSSDARGIAEHSVVSVLGVAWRF